VGFNYTYYAFFSCFLFVVATLIAYSRQWNRRELAQGLSAVALVCLATAINLMPSWYAWRTLGKPTVIPVKHAVEADQYGLKIRNLVSPIFDHTFPLLARWSARERAEPFVDEAEPQRSRLGLVATGGFVILLAALVTSSTDRLVSDGTLLATAGGWYSPRYCLDQSVASAVSSTCWCP